MSKERVAEFIKNPRKALFTLAMPVVVANIVQIGYNVVDTAFVGRLGADAIAALTFSFPLFFILLALNSGISVGMGSRISRSLGAGNKETAENAAMHGLLLSILLSMIIFGIGIFTLEPLFLLFGASANVLNLAMDYMVIILSGVFFMLPSFVFSSIFSSQGDTKTPMKIQAYALIANAILDPIFIYTLGLGVKGAAIASVIAFAFSVGLSLLHIKKSYLKIHLDSFKFSWKIVKEIFAIGVPSSIMILILSIYVIFLNKFMAHFGTEYVAAFGIASRLESFAILPIVAISLSLMTLVGMFLGAKRYDLVKDVSWYGIKMGALLTSIVGIVFLIAPELFLHIFSSDQEIIKIGAAYMRIEVFTFPLMTVSMIVSRIMQGMGFGFPSLLINLLRVFIVAVPLAYLFVYILNLGFLSIAVAMVLGGLASTILAVIWLNRKFVHLEKVHKPKLIPQI